jgi:hypothetical protein
VEDEVEAAGASRRKATKTDDGSRANTPGDFAVHAGGDASASGFSTHDNTAAPTPIDDVSMMGDHEGSHFAHADDEIDPDDVDAFVMPSLDADVSGVDVQWFCLAQTCQRRSAGNSPAGI